MHSHQCKQDQKDVANICLKQTSKGKELWTLHPIKTIHIGATLEKSLHHSRKPKQKRPFLNMLQFEGVEIEKVDYVPNDVNGTHIYRINCLENEWIEHQKDCQWWKMHTSSRKGFQGKRKIGTCKGHFMCTNKKWNGAKAGMSANQFCFQQVGPDKICSTCGMFAE